jgi:hypothetical protein
MQARILLLALLLFVFSLKAQDEAVFGTFKGTRIINSHSTETLKKGMMDFRITHRFGDMMRDWSARNSWDNFIGLEDAADILIGLEYGVTDQLMLSFSRTKGAGPLRQLLHGQAKYKVLAQNESGSMPISMAVVGLATISTMRKTNFEPANPSITSFTTCDSCGGFFANRWRYALELHIARKFSHAFSLQASPILVWRNLVENGASNALISLNLGTRIQLSKSIGLLLDANIPFSGYYFDAANNYQIPIGVALEFETAGHIFQINFSNSRGIATTDYVPDTRSDWANGEFRLGFTISRAFILR